VFGNSCYTIRDPASARIQSDIQAQLAAKLLVKIDNHNILSAANI
jgi:hypothetical protein